MPDPDYSKLTVVKLRDALKQRNLPQAGLKAALVARLVEDDANQLAAANAARPLSPVGGSPKPPLEHTPLPTSSKSRPELPSDPSLNESSAPPASTPRAQSSERSKSTVTEDVIDVSAPQETVPTPASRFQAEPESKTSTATTSVATTSAVTISPATISTTNAAGQPETAPAPSTSLQPEPESKASQIDNAFSRLRADQVTEAAAQDEKTTSVDVAASSISVGEDSKKVDNPEGATETASNVVAAPEDPAQEDQSRIVQHPADQPGESHAHKSQPDEAPLYDAQSRLTELPSITPHSSQDPAANAALPSNMTPIPTTESQPLKNNDEMDDIVMSSRMSAESQAAAAYDSLKRKRRSKSPLPSTQDVAMKRLKGEDGSPRVARFQGLFGAPTGPSRGQASQIHGADDRDVAPAVHPATTALYIRNFMRPLHPNTLKEYLVSLAEPGNDASEEEVILEFYLDSIKTHCLVQFASVAAASRVRLALHDNVWPNERSRKALWVDFIPEEKLKKWIEIESESANSRPPKRWEIVYESESDGITAYLQEVEAGGRGLGGSARRLPPIEPARSGVAATPTSSSFPAKQSSPATMKGPIPTGPRADSHSVTAGETSAHNFKAIDEIFPSTNISKPKIYFLPVSREIVAKRQAILFEESRAEERGGKRDGARGDEMRRYTFEKDKDEEERLVDTGPEYPFGNGGFRGGRGRGGGGGGGYGGRGGGRGGGLRGYDRYQAPRMGGDSWRGDY